MAEARGYKSTGQGERYAGPPSRNQGTTVSILSMPDHVLTYLLKLFRLYRHLNVKFYANLPEALRHY